ncbi:hypothetical protein LJR220_003392 [Bradyrhizobium sp. LjRoot220]|uniref:hypothetical protein n=1 Tax=Bradyrhizobium sp. LjRoot220 TaxID=3342284 RepID=UPI003ECE1348
MNETSLNKRNGYSMVDDLQPILDGKQPVPNATSVVIDAGATILHYREMHCGTALFPDGKKQWSARFFLDYGQGGGLYGSGVVAWVEWKDGAYRAVAMKFAICDHKPVAGPGANPSRGWRPASCEKCGLDMSVDSGD